MPASFRRGALVAAALVALAAPARAQEEGVLQVGDDLHVFLERQQAAGRLPGVHLDVQPLSAYEAAPLLDSLAADSVALSAVDRALLARFRGERAAPGAGLARRLGLYRDGEHLVSAAGDGYRLILEPLGYFALGGARQTAAPGREPTAATWQNTRGVRAAGHIGRHLFFETRLEENQRQPVLLEHDGRTAPRLGLVKLPGGDTYDYWRAMGVVGYRDRFLEVRFGRDRNRWGFGTNSLVLSDYAPPSDQLQVRARVGPVAYTSLVARFTDPAPPPGATGDTFLPTTYGAFHRLTLNLPWRVQLAAYESVIFADDTAQGRRRGFELAYLNPILFYRALEADLGSPDNVLLGAGAAWTPVGGVRVYGDLFLDELKVSELGNAWWGNKWAYLLGAHVAVPGVAGLDARLEFARLRPYLYSHRSLTTAYVHYGDVLGHPAGPNAQDLALFLRYRPTPALRAALDVAYTLRGRNADSLNYGADPTIGYDVDRVSDYGVHLLQGIRQSTWLVEGRVGYEVLPDLLVEAVLLAESISDAEAGLYRYAAGLVQLRWGLPFRSERW